jgi:hypothetical protein
MRYTYGSDTHRKWLGQYRWPSRVSYASSEGLSAAVETVLHDVTLARPCRFREAKHNRAVAQGGNTVTLQKSESVCECDLGLSGAIDFTNNSFSKASNNEMSFSRSGWAQTLSVSMAAAGVEYHGLRS